MIIDIVTIIIKTININFISVSPSDDTGSKGTVSVSVGGRVVCALVVAEKSELVVVSTTVGV